MNTIINPFSEIHIDMTLTQRAKEPLRNIWLKWNSRVLAQLTVLYPSAEENVINTKIILFSQSSRHDLLKYISDAQQYKLKSGRSKEIQFPSVNRFVDQPWTHWTKQLPSLQKNAAFFPSYTCLQLILSCLLVAWALMNDAWSSIFKCCTSMMNWVHLESSLEKKQNW